jgi:hypothetical protein
MKECFREKKFGERALEIIERADGVCADYFRQGMKMTVRQLYYQFVSKNWIQNLPENYETLSTVISEARIAGMIDWDHIEDRGRVTHTQPAYKSLKSYLQQLTESYRLNKWKAQKHYVEVMIEKQALEGVIYPTCERWGVPLTANKGYGSTSMMYERGKYLQSMRDVEGKEIHVIYLGDHDPSGIDMSRDVQDRCEEYSDGPVDVMRLALNFDQVQRHNLPENPTKMKDSRAADYISKYGMSCWELDALPPATLVALVENGIKGVLDLKLWDKMEKTQQADQDTLQTIVEEIPEASE